MSGRNLARAIEATIPWGDPSDDRPLLRRIYGEVTDVSPLTVDVMRSGVEVELPCVASYYPKVGDFVAIDSVNGDMLVLGTVTQAASTMSGEWTALSRAAGWGANPFGWNDVRYVVEGRWVSLEGLFYRSGGTVTGAQTLGTLPPGARPVTSCPLPVGWSNQSAAVSWSVDNAGNVATRADAGFLASFPVGTFMGITGRFPLD